MKKTYEYIEVRSSSENGHSHYVSIGDINEKAKDGWKLVLFREDGHIAVMEREILND